MFRRVVISAVVVMLLLAAVLVGRTLTAPALPPAEPRVAVAVDAPAAVAHFAGALKFPTVSESGGAADPAAFHALHAYLEQTFPLVHQKLTREVVNDLSLLYVWPGADRAARPIVLMAHLDVVPVIPGTEGRWTHSPFSGDVAGGFVWGRGSIDDKASLTSTLEAIEQLLREGYQPPRTVVLAFGHDEEIGGTNGARRLLERYRALGFAAPALVLDEGGFVGEGIVPGVRGAVAMIGLGEKGNVSLRLRVEGEGGHSSVPPPTTHIGRLARAIAALEASPFPPQLDPAGRAMLEALTPVMPFGRRLALSNLWLFGPLVARGFAANPTTAVMVRTTTAPTVFHAGSKENVLPPEAEAVVNFRIRPGETVQSVIQRVTTIIGDPAVKIEPRGFAGDPPPLSDPSGRAYSLVARTIRQTLGHSTPLVVPFVCPGATDSRYWSAVSNAVFRFTPFPLDKDTQERAHGTNERMGADAYVDAVRFYVQLLRGLERLKG